MKNTLLIAFVLMLFVACGDKKSQEESAPPESMLADEFEGLHERATTLFGALPEVAESADNPITDEKVLLGQKLYFDVRLSKDNTQSCNTCHDLATFGVDNKQFSPGNDGGLGDRNSPTTLNAALHFVQFWDGREPHVEAQAGGPILNPVEMAMPSEAAVIERLSAIEEYVDMFGKAFPEEASPITYDNLKKAIGAFERKLITPSKFDEYMKGDQEALTNVEKAGLQTFIDGGCITCHTGNLLGGNMYQKFGLMGEYWPLTGSEHVDEGRFKVTNNEVDKYMFKVPSLRNVEKTGPYFHDGSVADLKEAIVIMGKIQLNKEFTDRELNDMIAFLSTLTGEVPAELAAAPAM